MKITPISSGSGDPGTMIGNIEVGSSISSDKKANAIRVMRGEKPVTRPDQPDPQAQRIQKRRTLTMNTNATPGRMPEDIQLQEAEAITQPVTPDPVEAAAEETKPLSPQFAALAKQKRSLQIKERELAEREKALSGQHRPDLMAQLEADPLSVLQRKPGLLDKLTDQLLANPADPSQVISSEIKALREENKVLRDSIDQKFNERDAQAEQQVLHEIGKEAQAIVSERTNEFKAIKIKNALPKVVDLIYRQWKRDGDIIPTEEALMLVEKQIYEEEVDPFVKAFGQSTETPVPQQQAAPQRQMRTLTNRDGSMMQLTSKQRAMLAFEGKLKRG